ncbi:MAG: ECF transporter S component [Eubacteriales bacterium]|jgi:uncharacterized membrane protein
MKLTSGKTVRLTLYGLLTGILILMACTPLGYLNIGPLAITFNMIPVAIAAITLGPAGGAIIGAVFGMTSFLQCMGILGMSGMGAATFAISPFLTFVQRMLPRVLDGFLLGYIYRFMRKHSASFAACAVTGFFAAFLNTLLFMGLLVLLFGNTAYVQNLMGGHNVIVGVCLMIGVNAIFEMLASTVITGAVGTALVKAGFTARRPEAVKKAAV